MNKPIQFIYFDIGGVVILDFSKTNKWREMMDDLGVNDTNRNQFENLFDEMEPSINARLDLNTFVDAAKLKLDFKFPEGYSMLDDFVNRFEPNLSIHPIINELKDGYKIGLLTNMYPGLLDAIRKRNLLPKIDWDVIVDSSVVGYIKPQDDIYKLAEEIAQNQPENILFVENSSGHVEAAKKRSWQTLLYDPSKLEESNSKLKNYLL